MAGTMPELDDDDGAGRRHLADESTANKQLELGGGPAAASRNAWQSVNMPTAPHQ
jgi:hypothetical protein